MKLLVLLISLLLVFPVIAQDDLPLAVLDECPYFMDVLADDADASISCGYLHVPENRQASDSPTLELFFVWIESIQDMDNAPVINLEGGPGGAASIGLEGWLESGLRDNYDIILIDQRGTGLSYPSLNCFEYDEVDDDSWVGLCRDRLLDDGVDLNMYHSVQNANDIHDLLVALDFEDANLYGSSYGTRLALTVARDFPDRIRTLMIDAVYPPHVDSLVEQAYNGNQAFEQLFADCSADSACDTAYPNLRDSFYTAIDNMNDAPPEIEDYDTGFLIEMTGDDFANQVFTMMYDSTLLAYLPALIDAYAKGEYAYDPRVEAEQIILEQSIINGTIEPDIFDIAAMELLNEDDVDNLYAYYFTLDDDEYDDLMIELEDYVFYTPFRDYLGYDSIDEAADYVDYLDDETYYELEAEVTGYYDDDSEGMFMSVECAEEIPFYDEDDVFAGIGDLPDAIGYALAESALVGFSDCEAWDVQALSDLENKPVISDIPTLILSGAYDPITPPQWGAKTQPYLSTSWHYIFPNVGHGALDTSDCVNEIVLSFLDSPSQDPDSACMQLMTAPEFFIRQS